MRPPTPPRRRRPRQDRLVPKLPLIHDAQAWGWVIQQSMTLEFEPSSEPLHIFAKQFFFDCPQTLQGHLAHKKTPTPLEPPRTLGTGLPQGPRGVRFLVSEVTLDSSLCLAQFDSSFSRQEMSDVK